MMATAVLSRAVPRTREAATPLWRLTAVELRKMADTRAGIWLIAIIQLLAASVVVIRMFTGDADGRTFGGFFNLALIPVNMLLPVLAILSVTSEWSQRTALTTFALTPRRGRVAAAKILAIGAIGLFSVATCLVTAAIGNAVAASALTANGSWHFTAAGIGYAALFQLLGMFMGLGFGMLLMNPQIAIVLYFILPTVWSMLGAFISSLEKPSRWLDMARTMQPLLDDRMTADNWAKLGTSVAVWIALPVAIGTVRLLRREVK